MPLSPTLMGTHHYRACYITIEALTISKRRGKKQSLGEMSCWSRTGSIPSELLLEYLPIEQKRRNIVSRNLRSTSRFLWIAFLFRSRTGEYSITHRITPKSLRHRLQMYLHSSCPIYISKLFKLMRKTNQHKAVSDRIQNYEWVLYKVGGALYRI